METVNDCLNALIDIDPVWGHTAARYIAMEHKDSTSYFSQACTSIAMMLENCFSWAETEEGSAYWNDVTVIVRRKEQKLVQPSISSDSNSDSELLLLLST